MIGLEMRTIVLVLISWIWAEGQIWQYAKIDTLVTVYGGKQVVIQTGYLKDKDKVTVMTTKNLGYFDSGFEKYVKEKPQLSDKELSKLLKDQEKKVLAWCKKHQEDIGVLTAKNTCKQEATAWPIEKLSQKQLDDLIAGIFKRSDIACFIWDLSGGIGTRPSTDDGKDRDKCK